MNEISIDDQANLDAVVVETHYVREYANCNYEK